MTAHIAAWGRLVADPEQRETRAGKPWATARLAVPMPLPYGADEGSEPPVLWLSVNAFGERAAETLARHVKGECLSVAGRLELRPYTARTGERREGWTCIADSVIGPRSPRPKAGRPKAAGNGAPAADPARAAGPDGPEPPPFNDSIPF